MNTNTPICRILDLARWAPSGDNTQNARFEILSPTRAIIHGYDTRDHVVYDLDGHASQMALGALIETADIAASTEGGRVTICRKPESAEHLPTFDIEFHPDPSAKPNRLAAYIKTRSVQRRPFSTRPLLPEQLATLESTVKDGYRVTWLSSFADRRRLAMLLFQSAKIRLTMKEAYEVHRSIIEWQARYSEDKVPDQALGADPLTTRLMEFVLGSWDRVRFFNRFFAGTWMPRIQLDFIPAIACASHFLLVAERPPQTIDDYVEAGRQMQRFWLTATELGLQVQPEITPLVFARYAREGRRFSADPGMLPQAEQVQVKLNELVGTEAADCTTFLGRIGFSPAARARSLRMPFDQMLIS